MPRRPDEMWPLTDEDSKPFREMLSKLDKLIEEQARKGLGRRASAPIVLKFSDFEVEKDINRAREAIRSFMNQGWRVRLGSFNEIELYDVLSDIFSRSEA